MKVDSWVLIIPLTIDAPGLKANNAMGGTSKQVKKDWGLGGVLIMDDAPDGKKAGTMLWGGLPNLIWVSLGPNLLRPSPFHGANLRP